MSFPEKKSALCLCYIPRIVYDLYNNAGNALRERNSTQRERSNVCEFISEFVKRNNDGG